jgi:sugar lactone lactonase YvrE
VSIEVFDDRRCELGEGPMWHPERRQFFWFDIMGMRLLSRANGEALDWPMGEHASAAGWIDADHLLIATETGLYRFEIATGDRELIAPLEADDPTTRSNDGRADPMGGFWIGTMCKKAGPGRGGIYRYYKGEVRQLVSGITVPNAICFTRDGTRAYYTCSRTRQILSQALDDEGWPTGPSDVFLDLRDEGLNPDGAVVDSEDHLWSAQWGAGRVARYRPDGTFERAVPVPGSQASCPAFGGENLDQMLVTTAWEGMESPGEADGLTYLVIPGVRGMAEHRVGI